MTIIDTHLPNMVIKIFSYLSAADPAPPSTETPRPYFEIALNLFGASRLMYGGDWPVCRLGDSYAAGIHMLRTLANVLIPDKQADIWGRTAMTTDHLQL